MQGFSDPLGRFVGASWRLLEVSWVLIETSKHKNQHAITTVKFMTFSSDRNLNAALIILAACCIPYATEPSWQKERVFLGRVRGHPEIKDGD